MIVKVLTRHSPSYKSLINYIIDGSKDKDGKEHFMTHNLRSDTRAGYEQEFIENEALRKNRRSDQIYMYHEIISISANEDIANITDTMLNDLAQKYISLRGSNGIFVGAVHLEKEHVHIHFISSGTEFRTGKAFRLSKHELQSLKIKFQEYHQKKYPELTESTVLHGHHAEYVTNKKWQVQHRDGRQYAKEQIQATITECFLKATTQKEFLESLRNNDLHFYERNSTPAGIIYENLKIRFSRLGIQFDKLRPDRTEEEKALAVIQQLRKRDNNKELELSK